MDRNAVKRPVVLCVDDEPTVLASLGRVLADSSRFVATQDVREALECVESGTVDLVIADHRMPGVGGLEFLERVARVSSRTARMLLTGYPDAEVFNAVTAGRVHRVLVKPWDDEELQRTVDELLQATGPGIHPPSTSTQAIVTLDCRGRGAAGLVAKVLARRGRGEFVLVLSGADEMNGSPEELLAGIERVATEPITVVDPSGIVVEKYMKRIRPRREA